MRVLQDRTQKRVQRHFCTTVVIDRGNINPTMKAPLVFDGGIRDSARWNSMHMPERVPVKPVEPEIQASGGRRQHLAPRNTRRLYRPQDQRGVSTVFVIIDRETGQVLARVRGSALWCEREAEQLARSQGCELDDLRIIFEGELA